MISEKRRAGLLPDARLAGMNDSNLNRVFDDLDGEPSWFQSFYEWILEHWDEILAVLLQILIILENENQ